MQQPWCVSIWVLLRLSRVLLYLQARFILNDQQMWADNDHRFRGEEFFRIILRIFRNDPRWAKSTLAWWNKYVFNYYHEQGYQYWVLWCRRVFDEEPDSKVSKFKGRVGPTTEALLMQERAAAQDNDGDEYVLCYSIIIRSYSVIYSTAPPMETLEVSLFVLSTPFPLCCFMFLIAVWLWWVFLTPRWCLAVFCTVINKFRHFIYLFLSEQSEKHPRESQSPKDTSSACINLNSSHPVGMKCMWLYPLVYLVYFPTDNVPLYSVQTGIHCHAQARWDTSESTRLKPPERYVCAFTTSIPRTWLKETVSLKGSSEACTTWQGPSSRHHQARHSKPADTCHGWRRLTTS